MTVGNPFSLALYDKQQRQVTSSVREEQGPQRQGVSEQIGQSQQVAEARTIGPTMQAIALSPSETQDAALAALSPAVIKQLHGATRCLNRPQFKALVTGFRQRFHLVEGDSVVAAITQKQHNDGIEAFLVQVEGRP